jgi:hypothetical protein
MGKQKSNNYGENFDNKNTHPAEIFVLSQFMCSSINYSFIWNGKPDKVKRLTLLGDYEKGGLNMVDINSYFKSLKVSWGKRLLSSEISNWKVILRNYLDKFGETIINF